MPNDLQELRERLAEINDLHSAAALLHWDQSTYMPPRGGAARGRQLATLSRLAHEKFVDGRIGELLGNIEESGAPARLSETDAAMVRLTRREYDRAVKVPPDFMAEFHRHTADTYETWKVARPKDDFALVRDKLARTVELSRRMAEFFPGFDHVADPLIDFVDEGVTVATLRELFGRLRAELTPLVREIAERPAPDDACLRGHFPEADQIAFAREIIERFGYDFERGRCDKTPHPFMTKFSLDDVRITTRCDESFIGETLFSTMHEAGHALYEQGINPEFEGTPLAEGCSSGVHESQSRLWENLVGRSDGFWSFAYPKLQQRFPSFSEIPLDTFFRAINISRPSLIRTDADEVTYNLHVLIRFDLECALLEGNLSVSDLPDAWNERYEKDLGLRPPDDRNGCLQDMHWFGGMVGGMFQCYTLGNILAAQFYDAAVAAEPGIPDAIARGEFSPLLNRLRECVHRFGHMFRPEELVERATGGPMTIAPYMNYLRRKFGELYGL